MANPNKLSKMVFSILCCTLISLCFMCSASAQTMTVKAEASDSQPQVGDTLTVNIKISNAQNLFGVDITLNWNPEVLTAISATPILGVESHPDGVLHESSTYPIEVIENTQTAEQYHLLATSTGSTTPSFSGSGTIATVIFNVTNTGATGLALDVELSQSGNSDPIVPSTSVDSVNIVAIPEFPLTLLIVVLLIAVTATVIASNKLLKQKALPQKIAAPF
jgi:hypothetical protein